ncbi:SIR2 family protein [Kocuria sp. M1R5S2]|uniref:P-loop NTPase n=1 Tax=Kocuria rhizosphaerae TaxID=3376285 RepID=UPI00379712CC
MDITANADDFVSRLHYLLATAEKPVAFVVGSGMTRGTVPGVADLLRSMREALNNKRDERRFDAAIEGTSGGEAYQRAARFIFNNRGQGFINRIVRLAVMKSCPAIGPSHARDLSIDENALYNLEITHDWNLDPGVRALGQMLATMPEGMIGPVITTNFDPHVEVAIRLAGGKPNTQWFDVDGEIKGSESSDSVDVVHVHGLWRKGDTLHTVHQLTRERPMLSGSLREMLRNHEVVIIGYSGWSDAFSNSLLERAKERQSLGMNILWCTFGPAAHSDLPKPLFSEMAQGNSAVLYEGVDANKELPRLLGMYQESVANSLAPAELFLKGWTRVGKEFAEEHSSGPQQDLDTSRFFEGAAPSWHVAFNPKVPRLALARELENSFGEHAKIITAGIAPMGEGKSMALMQVVTSLVGQEGNHVFWREAGAILDVQRILECEVPDGQTLILATDDGDLLIDQIKDLVRECDITARSNIRVLLVAAERDWRNAGGFTHLRSKTYLVTPAPLQKDDAQAIIDAWAAVAGFDLQEIASVPSGDRAEYLRVCAADDYAGERGSLIGGMLRARYGSRLKERVSDLLDRLRRVEVASGLSLADAFLMISILHTAHNRSHYRNGPLSLRILAAAFRVPTGPAEFMILEPLGKEAAVRRHDQDVWIRHSAIAESALEASRSYDPKKVGELINRMVPVAIGLAEEGQSLPADIYAVAYLSRSLPSGDDAIEAGKAACQADPNRLSYVTSLMSAYRDHGKHEEALKLAESAWLDRLTWVDKQSFPGFLLDWGTAAGQSGEHALNVLVDAVAAVTVAQSLDKEDLPRALLGLGVGLRNLHRQTGNDVYGEALSGVVTLVGQLDLSARDEGFLKAHGKYLRTNKVANVLDDLRAVAAVKSAIDGVQENPPKILKAYLASNPIDITGVLVPIEEK